MRPLKGENKMFIAIWRDCLDDLHTWSFENEESLKDSAFNDPSFPTDEVVIHKLCNTTFEVVDTFKLRLTQI